MSLGGADAKFPFNKDNGIPPSPSRENPGQVYPKSDPHSVPTESIPGTGGEREPASFMGNPYAQNDVFGKLHTAIDEAISAVEKEEESTGTSSNENATLRKLRQWRAELGEISTGGRMGRTRTDPGTPREGGLFVD